MEITHVCPADSEKKTTRTFLRNITRKTDRKSLVIIKNTIQYIQKSIFPRMDRSRPAGRAAGEYPHKLRHALHQHPLLPLYIIHYIKSKNTW